MSLLPQNTRCRQGSYMYAVTFQHDPGPNYDWLLHSLTLYDYSVPFNNGSVLSPYFTYIHRSLLDLLGTSYGFLSPPYNTL